MNRPTLKRRSLHTKTSPRMSKRLRSLFLEHLESRVLLAIDLSGVPTWVEQGPGPSRNGQTEGIANNPVTGSVQALAAHPTNANILFAGGSNGGVWRTTNATAAAPTWAPLTDQFQSISVGGMAMNPTNPNEILAAIGNRAAGNFDALGAAGGDFTGALYTTDALAATPTWRQLSNNISGSSNQAAALRAGYMLVAGSGGLYRSLDGGNTFTLLSGTSVLPNGPVLDLFGDPGNANRFYAAGQFGMVRCDDLSVVVLAACSTVTDPQMNIGGTTNNIRIGIHNAGGNNVVYVGVVNNGQLAALTWSNNLGVNWTGMDVPGVIIGGASVGIQPREKPGSQGGIHFSLVADPTNANLVYVGGDRQQGTGANNNLFPNPIGANTFSGNLFRGDRSVAQGAGVAPLASAQWTPLTHNFAAGGGSPHADSRRMVFDFNGDIIESDDGGVYRRTSPANAAGTWQSVNGNLTVAEFWTVSLDTVNTIVFGGTQDTGTVEQSVSGNITFDSVTLGDGFFTAVDNTSIANSSVRYTMGNTFTSFQRRVFNNLNTQVGATATVQLAAPATPANIRSGLNATDVAANASLNVYVLNATDPRLMMVGATGVYEDNNAAGNAGDIVSTVTPAAMTGFVRAIAYGGRRAGVAYPQVAWVGTQNGELFVRGEAGGFAVSNTGGAGQISDIVLDPDNWQTAYVLQGNSVFMTIDGGVNYTNITSNLGTVTSQVRSLAIWDPAAGTTAGNEIILVGGRGGVYRLLPSGSWSEYGPNLPNTIVEDLQVYGNRLLAGTYGRGAWMINDVSPTIAVPGILTITGDMDFVNENDVIRIVRDANNPTLVNVFLNNLGPVPNGQFSLDAIEQINVFSLGGNDQLIVDSTNGLIDVPNGVFYNGGTGFDRLDMRQETGTQVSETIHVGQTPGEGQDILVGSNGQQVVQFENLEPVSTNIVAPAFAITSLAGLSSLLQDSNQINYMSSPAMGATWGRVTVDNFEFIDFTNKGALTIDAGAGSDDINLGNPFLPDGLTSIQVNGDDPTASDTLTVTGTVGPDTVTYTPTGVGAGSLLLNGLTMIFTTTEHVLYSGLTGGDTMTINGTGNDDSFVVDPTNGGRGSQRANLFPTFDYTGANAVTANGGAGGFDVLTIHGSEGNDSVTSAANVITVVGQGTATIGTNLDRVDINTFSGSDAIALAGLTLPMIVEAGAGNDLIRSALSVRTTLLGGVGDDAIFGGAGADRLEGGDGADMLVGGGGDDFAFGGAGSDTFVWNPGDADDLFEGDEGDDTLAFAGANGNDAYIISSDNGRVLFTRQPGNVGINMGSVENIISNSETIEMSGRKEIPANTSTSSGFANFVFNPATGLYDIRIFVLGIAVGNLADSHIHMAIPGSNGPVVIPFGGGGVYTAVAGGLELVLAGQTLATIVPPAGFTAQEVLTEILLGRAYFNVHTTANPGGELRGNIIVSGPTAGSGGADSLIVRDVTGTALRSIVFNAGNEAEIRNGAPLVDSITIEAPNTPNNLSAAITNVNDNNFLVSGLPYNVLVVDSDGNIASGGQRDVFILNGNGGDDSLKVLPGVETFTRVTLNGGAGDDVLSADALLIGGPGDDFLEGGAGDDTLQGDAGEDTMVGGGGNDTYDGGQDYDTILVRGTSGNDTIQVIQTNATTLVYTVQDQLGNTLDGGMQTDTFSNTERVRIEAGAGDDLMRVSVSDALFVTPNASLLFDIDGGQARTRDRMAVIDDGADDLSIYRKGESDSDGSITIGPANAEPFDFVFTNVEYTEILDDTNRAITLANNNGRVVVFKHDSYEANNDLLVATHLGAGQTINVDPTIDPGSVTTGAPFNFTLPADEDWYRVEALANGTLDFQVFFEQITAVGARPGLPGNGDMQLQLFDSDGLPGAIVTGAAGGFGTNDATSNERIRIPAVEGQIYYLRVFGATGTAVNNYSMTIINVPAPVPRDMELLDNPVGDPPPANSDTGRSQFDNITRDNTPTLVFRLDDAIFLNDLPGNNAAGAPPDEVIPIPFQAAAGTAGYRIAIFDEGPLPIVGTTAPQVPLGFATFVSAGVYQFTTPVLLDGSHFLTARVQMVDPASPQQTGFGERSVALEVIVDTTVPPGFFGQVSLADITQGLAAASDSGVVGDPATFVDRVTNDTTPSFYGRAEANTIVRMYAETNGVAGLQSTGAGADLFLGLTVADPLDGSNQFPGGQWSFTTPLDLNNPSLGFAEDGARSLYMTAEDLAGNTTPDAAADRLDIFLDTAGPQLTNVEITGTPAFNLFGLKPDNAVEGPTPRVDGLTIRVRDLPNRSNLDPNFLYGPLQQTVAVAPGNYVLKGDHNGIIAIRSIVLIPVAPVNGAIATGRIELEFFAPLPDDRYTLTIKDTVVDPVGNKLDGESNAAEPIGNPSFPTGNGIPGGDFVARFTVDSRPEVGVVAEGIVYVDINGNFVWDPEGKDRDSTNRDLVFQFGQLVDAHFAGNFAPVGAAAASGYDKLGAYGQFAGTYSFVLDTNDDGVADFSSLMPIEYQVNGIPVAGNFSAAHPGDEIGLFDGSFWYLDTDGDNEIDFGERVASNFNGLPIVGDFNGDGQDDLAVFNNATNIFTFDTNRDGVANFTWKVADDVGRFVGLSGFTDRPVAGDLNLDGIDDIGLWVKDRQGTLPRNSGEYFFWVSDRVNPNPAFAFDSFSPDPLGNDLFAEFGDEFGLPIFGNFDPPVGQVVDSNPLHNTPSPLDVDSDGFISPLDALVVVNVLNNYPKFPSNDPVRTFYTIGQMKADPDNDRTISPLDVLNIINYLNSRSNGGAGEGEADTTKTAAVTVVPHGATDEFFAQLGADLEIDAFKKKRR